MDFSAFGIDPSVAQQFALPDDERRRLLLANILLGAGAGLGSARKGQEAAGLAGGLAGGGMMAQQAVANAAADRFNQFKMGAVGQEFLDRQKAAKQAQLDQQQLGNIFSGGPDLSQMGPGGPTPDNAQAVAAHPMVDKYRQAAAFYASRGNADMAKKMSDIAEQMQEKFSTTPQVTRGADGRLQLVQFGERGGTKVAQDMTPAEKAHFADTGGSIVPLDPYTGAPIGAATGKSMTPGEVASNKLGWANYGLARDKANQEKAEQYGTPIQITSPDGATQLMIPKKGTNELVPMIDPSGNAVTKSASIPQKYKDTQYSLSNLRDNIAAYNNELKNFSGSDYMNPTKRAAIEARFGAVQMNLKNLFELGALAGPDIEILNQNLTNPLSPKGMSMNMMGKGLEEQNKIIGEMLSRAEGNLANSYNQPTRGQPAQRQVVRTGIEQGTGRRVVKYSDGSVAYQ